MPLYEYECRDCQARFERLTSMRDADATACPKCGVANARRLISVIGGISGSGSYSGETAPPMSGCGAGACGNC